MDNLKITDGIDISDEIHKKKIIYKLSRKFSFQKVYYISIMNSPTSNEDNQVDNMSRVQFERKTTRRHACVIANNKKDEQKPSSLIEIDELMNYNDKDSTAEIDDPQNNESCKICYSKMSSVTFNPCSHKCACAKCSIKVLRYQKKCPLCRQEVESYALDKENH